MSAPKKRPGKRERQAAKRTAIVKANLAAGPVPKSERHSGSLGCRLAKADERLHAGRVGWNASLEGGSRSGSITRGKFKAKRANESQRFAEDEFDNGNAAALKARSVETRGQKGPWRNHGEASNAPAWNPATKARTVNEHAELEAKAERARAVRAAKKGA